MPKQKQNDKPVCHVIVSKDANVPTEMMCGNEATHYFPIADGPVVTDMLLLCTQHSDLYDQGHSIVVADLRGNHHLIQLPPLNSTSPDATLEDE